MKQKKTLWSSFPTQAGAKGECRRIQGTDGTLQMPGFDNKQVMLLIMKTSVIKTHDMC